MKIAIVTDSTSDIPTDLAEKYQIHIIPALLEIEGDSYSDGEGISRQEFYEKLPSMRTPPTTAAPSSSAFQYIYDILIQQGAQYIISLHPPRSLTAISNIAESVARSYGHKIRVIDTGQVTLGSGFQVIAAAEAVINRLSLEDVLAYLNNVRQRIHLVAMLDTMEYIRRSGRVSWARASFGSLLQIKPFIELHEGEVHRLGEVRTRQKGIQRLYNLLHDLGRLEMLAILHTNAERDANIMRHDFMDRVEIPPLVVNVTSVIGAHVGPNGLGFVAVVK
jgi:DegV family protein with EDD domain